MNLTNESFKPKDWSILYRWMVILILFFQFIGTAALVYAGKSYVRDIAVETVTLAIRPIENRVNSNTENVSFLRNFAANGPLFTATDAKLLKSESVSEATNISAAQTEKLSEKIDILTTQISEIKVMLAGIRKDVIR
jgi:hypothetical protein